MNSMSRRHFVKTTAASATAASLFNILRAQGGEGLKGSTIKVGVIGCGGRSGSDVLCMREAAKILGVTVKFIAIADVFQDRIDGFAKRCDIDPSVGHVGYDAYQKVAASDAEIVLMATPPNFRPLHLEACIRAGKHCFVQKPVAVDPVGARKVMEIGELAKSDGLSIVAGTQRRSAASYRNLKAQIDAGAIGDIVGGVVSWNSRVPWVTKRWPNQSDAEYMTRNWLNFTELSGDHIVEQHVHQLDVTNWFMGRVPKTFSGMGGRARRVTGNQFDFFSVDMDYGGGIHIHSQCRQITGTYERVGELFRGTLGSTNGMRVIGKSVDVAPVKQAHPDGNIQQQIELIEGIRNGKPLNQAQDVADATLCAVAGRIACYTGQLVRWVDLTENTKSPFYHLSLSPAAVDFEKGAVVMPPEVAPIPGEADPNFS